MRDELIQAGRLLAQARRERRRITLPAPYRPRDLGEAYVLQDAIGRALSPGGAVVHGWKVGAPDAKTEPTAAPIYDVLRSPAQFPAAHFNMIGVEAEIAVVFGKDLPARTYPYQQGEVLAAVRGICVAIEVCDTRLAEWESADAFSKLADHQLNVALVTGDDVSDLTPIDFGAQEVRTWIDGVLLKKGKGCHALGNPLTLLPWLADHAGTRNPLKAGDVVTTGSWLGMHFIEPGANVLVEFPGVGSAAVHFPF